MSKVGDAIRRIVANKNPSGAGTVFIKPSEATPKNIQAITSSGATATVVSGSVTNPTKVSYVSTGGGGGGSSYVQTENPSQVQYQQEVQRQREVEVQRQNDLSKAANEKKRQEEIRKQALQRAVENKRLQNLSAMAEIERISRAKSNSSLNNNRTNYVINTEYINPTTGRPYGMISAVERQKGLAGVQQRTSQRLEALSTERLRTTSRNVKNIRGAYKRELEIAGLTAVGVGSSAIRGFIQLPKNLVNIVKNPKNIITGIRNIPKAVTRGGAEVGSLLRVSPTQALARVGSEVIILQSSGGALQVTGKLASRTAKKIIPQLNKAEKVYLVGKQTSKGRAIITNIYFKSGRNRFGAAKGISVQKGNRALTTSVGVSGKKQLGGGLKNVNVFAGIEKTRLNKVTPYIPLQNGLRIPVFNLRHVIQRSKGAVRSTALKNIRGKTFKKYSKDTFNSLSRVFTQKDLSVIIGSTITGKGNKAKFIGLIKNVRNKGSIGSVELSKLTKQQYQQALNKVVSVAAVSVSTARKLNKGKLTSAKTISKAREIVRQSLPTINLIKSRVPTNLRPITINRPTVSIRPGVAAVSTPKTITFEVTTKSNVKSNNKSRSKSRSSLRTNTITKQVPISASISKSASRLKVGQKLSRAQISKLKYKLITKGQGSRIIRIRVAKIKSFVPSKSKVQYRNIPTLKRTTNLYIPYAKVGNKYIRLSRLPLRREDALDRASYVTDNITSSTMKLEPVGRSKFIGKISQIEIGYFNRKHKKFRGYRIKKGNKYSLTDKFIEKRKFRIDTHGEKRGLTAARLIKQLNKSSRRIPAPRIAMSRPTQRRSRRVSPSQRRILLKRLEKARAVRMRNLRRKK